jgi:hypothetical protein
VVPRISYIPMDITCDFGLHLEMPNGMEHIMAKVNNTIQFENPNFHIVQECT